MTIILVSGGMLSDLNWTLAGQIAMKIWYRQGSPRGLPSSACRRHYIAHMLCSSGIFLQIFLGLWYSIHMSHQLSKSRDIWNAFLSRATWLNHSAWKIQSKSYSATRAYFIPPKWDQTYFIPSKWDQTREECKRSSKKEKSSHSAQKWLFDLWFLCEEVSPLWGSSCRKSTNLR